MYREVVAAGADRPGAAELTAADWVERVVLDSPPDPLLAKELGAGEAEVISLAHRRDVALVLLDDRRARRIASQAYDLRVRGTAGLLVEAKKARLLESVRAAIAGMREKGYFISDRVAEFACRAAGE